MQKCLQNKLTLPKHTEYLLFKGKKYSPTYLKKSHNCSVSQFYHNSICIVLFPKFLVPKSRFQYHNFALSKSKLWH